jgi:hypothetical protein
MRNLFIVWAKKDQNVLVLGAFKDRSDGLEFIQSVVTDQLNDHIDLYPTTTAEQMGGIKKMIEQTIYLDTVRYFNG